VLRDLVPTVQPGAWIDRNVILLGADSGLYRLDPYGGPAVKLDGHTAWGPSWLPGNRYLYVRQDGIFAGSLNGGEPVRILPDNSAPIFMPAPGSHSNGDLLFERKHALIAQPFNVDTLQQP
jgi:hypothetical protein